jgi:hypothetical protein
MAFTAVAGTPHRAIAWSAIMRLMVRTRGAPGAPSDCSQVPTLYRM